MRCSDVVIKSAIIKPFLIAIYSQQHATKQTAIVRRIAILLIHTSFSTWVEHRGREGGREGERKRGGLF